MTSKIYMNLDEVGRLEVALTQLAIDMGTQGDQLAGARHKLEAGWSGGKSDEFLKLYDGWLALFGAMGMETYRLSGRLSREVAQWMDADSLGPSRFENRGTQLKYLINENGNYVYVDVQIGVTDVLSGGWEVHQRYSADKKEYSGGKDRASAAIVDGLFVAGKIILSKEVGIAVATAVGGVVLAAGAPLWAVGLAGAAAFTGAAYATNYLANAAFGWMEDAGIKDAVVHGVSGAIDWTGDLAKSIGSWAGKGIDKLGDAMDYIGNGIGDIVSDVGSWFW